MNINLNRQVFDKKKFEETVNTNFTQLNEEGEPGFLDLNLATVGDFFELYGKLFFEIPKFGDVDSHEYLVKESGAYIDFDKINEEIQALLDEIAALREENLELRTEQITTLTEGAQLAAEEAAADAGLLGQA